MIADTHPDQDQHQNEITSRGSPLAHAYHVWSTSIRELSCSKMNEQMTDK